MHVPKQAKMVGIQIFVHFLLLFSVVSANDPMAEFSVTYQCPKCREVVESGVDYDGSDIRVMHNVASWAECKQRCTEEPKCKYWSHYDSESKCWLKTSNKVRKEVDRTSGTRGCGVVSIVSATADFTQNNLCGFKAPGLRGYRLENGDFIFSWKRGSRRMVLTDGQGNVKKWGAVQYGVATWQDPSTWITHDNRQHTVTNFK